MSRFTVGALVGLSMVAWFLRVIHAIGDIRTETFDQEIALIFSAVLLRSRALLLATRQGGSRL